MSQWIKPSGEANVTLACRSLSLYNDKTLSDVEIKLRDEQRIFGHKAFLARRSEWFLRAFTGNFPVASSDEICLDDEDDDPKAIRAMIRHIYDLFYEQDLFTSQFILDLMFHVNVFAAADKYDVPSLRAVVVHKFPQLMNQRWSTSQTEFCKVIQRLCGPNAANFADESLQASAASFCSEHIMDLIKLDPFVSMLEEGEPFAGRLLTAVLRGKANGVMETFVCSGCKSVSEDDIKKKVRQTCISCNSSYSAGRLGVVAPLGHYKHFMPI
ncbi:hypothetical protein KCU64_g8417, partial [Aureobasidium melanogenum]